MQPNLRGEGPRVRLARPSISAEGSTPSNCQPPTGLELGECLQFMPATGSQNQHTAVRVYALREKQRRHALQVLEARHHPHRTFGISRIRCGTIER